MSEEQELGTTGSTPAGSTLENLASIKEFATAADKMLKAATKAADLATKSLGLDKDALASSQSHLGNASTGISFVKNVTSDIQKIANGDVGEGVASLIADVASTAKTTAKKIVENGLPEEVGKLGKAASFVAKHADKIGTALEFKDTAIELAKFADGKSNAFDLAMTAGEDALKFGAELGVKELGKYATKAAVVGAEAGALPLYLAEQAAEYGIDSAITEAKIAIAELSGQDTGGMKHSLPGEIGLAIGQKSGINSWIADLATGEMLDRNQSEAKAADAREKMEAAKAAAREKNAAMSGGSELGGNSAAASWMDESAKNQPAANAPKQPAALSSWMENTPAQESPQHTPQPTGMYAMGSMSQETQAMVQQQLAAARGENASHDLEQGSASAVTAQQQQQAQSTGRG